MPHRTLSSPSRVLCNGCQRTNRQDAKIAETHSTQSEIPESQVERTEQVNENNHQKIVAMVVCSEQCAAMRSEWPDRTARHSSSWRHRTGKRLRAVLWLESQSATILANSSPERRTRHRTRCQKAACRRRSLSLSLCPASNQLASNQLTFSPPADRHWNRA